eukprot:4590820-Amphidinium_carterae.1
MAPGYHHPHCLDGAKYRKVEGWSFESTAAAACDACDGDSECLGPPAPKTKLKKILSLLTMPPKLSKKIRQ